MCAEVMDITRDESKRILRRLELEAYSSIISAFRAQGELSRTKKKILQDLGTQLSISTERHRAEVRRAYSDDRLAIVAESIYGAGSCAEWAAEGRRLVPLMPRLVPQTVFSASATAAANSTAAANAKVLASSGNKAGSSPTSVNANGNSSTSPNLQSNPKAATIKQQPPTGSAQCSDVDGYDDDGKPKRKRRLSVSSLNKPVTKVTIPTPTLVSKPLTKQTTSVSTMTKSGKALPGPAGTIKAIPRVSQLPASASQVKLLTKTIAVSQAICQSKTVLSYKTMTSVTSSTAKAQTVMTQSTPKTQTKLASGTPPKGVLASKTPLSSAIKNVTSGAVNPAITANPIGVALKTGLTAAQLAARHKVIKPPAARFKPLPGTVKFKSVTPATMGTCSTVTMVTPSPSSQSSSALPATSTQPVVRVIHVPGTGGVGVSKPVVVMTTGLSKATVAGAVPGISSPASLTKSTSQVMQNAAVAKTTVTTATTLSSPSKPKGAITAALSSASKTAGLTTLVGGTNRMVLSVPASLPPTTSISIQTTSSQGNGITKTQAIAPPQCASKKDAKITAVMVSPKLSPSQITPSLSAPTVTTQVRSRPLPAILPAPPKPPSVPQSAAGLPTTVTRKLPTILPAPAKNVTVFPTVLVPVATVGPHSAAQLQSSVSVAASTPGTSAAGVSVLDEVVGQKYLPVVQAGQETNPVSTDQANCSIQEIKENMGIAEISGSKAADVNEQSTVVECDNNTSSEDDSLLICSETIDSSCGITEAPTRLDFFPVMAESTPIKEQIEKNVEITPKEQVTDSNPLSLEDVVVSVSDLNTENPDKEDLVSETKPCETQLETIKESIENVTVQRVDDTGEISEIIGGSVSETLYSESLHDDDEEVILEPVVDVGLSSPLRSSRYDDRNVKVNCGEESLENAGLPVDNALHIIESFVESMEGDSGDTSEPNLRCDNSPFGFLQSSDAKSLDMPDVCTAGNKNDNNEEITAETKTDTSFQESHPSSNLPRFEEESWDGPIDVLSTSTSSSNSASESIELTEKEMRALEAFGNIRTSGRKRKPPMSLDASPLRQVSGWVRGALSLLQKVASYRGQGRRKGDFGAASWFLKPVDPIDAPGYFKVIKTPMDFGTIRVKLETGKYQEYTEFHSDMLLVKANCLKYNPPEHEIHQDCEDVFRFYEIEYAKMLERWEKCHVSPAKKPRVTPV